jgi:hypothetical protein
MCIRSGQHDASVCRRVQWLVCEHPISRALLTLLLLPLLLLLPPVYDYEYISPERGAFKKLVFLLW